MAAVNIHWSALRHRAESSDDVRHHVGQLLDMEPNIFPKEMEGQDSNPIHHNYLTQRYSP